MILRLTITFCFLSALVGYTVSKVPKEFQLCKCSSPDFEQCINSAIESSIKAIAGGMKDLEIPLLNPLNVPNFAIKGSGGPIDMSQYYEDCLFTGMTNAEYVEFVYLFDKDDCYFHAKSISNVTLIGKYRFTGRLLLFQLNGYGNANITLSNLVAWHNATCAFYEKDGLEYINVTNWVEDYHAGKVFYDFDNLIDANAELSAQVLQVMNENDLEVFESVRHGYEKLLGNIYMHFTNKVFSRIPWREIFLDC